MGQSFTDVQPIKQTFTDVEPIEKKSLPPLDTDKRKYKVSTPLKDIELAGERHPYVREGILGAFSGAGVPESKTPVKDLAKGAAMTFAYGPNEGEKGFDKVMSYIPVVGPVYRMGAGLGEQTAQFSKEAYTGAMNKDYAQAIHGAAGLTTEILSLLWGSQKEGKTVVETPKESPKVAAEAVTPKAQTPPSKLIYHMNPDELEAARVADKAKDDALLKELFGEEGAKKYKSLQRTANNSYDTVRADRASEELAQMEKKLTPEQEKRLYGMDQPQGTPTHEDFGEYRRSLNNIYGDTPQELGSSMRWAITKVGDIKIPPERMNPTQQMAYAQLRHGFEIADRMGWDKNQVLQSALQGAASRFEPNDAAFMLRQFTKQAASPKAAHPAPKSLPTLETTSKVERPKTPSSFEPKTNRLSAATGAYPEDIQMVQRDLEEAAKIDGKPRTAAELRDLTRTALDKNTAEFSQALQPIANKKVVPTQIADAIRKKITPEMMMDPSGRQMAKDLRREAKTYDKTWTLRDLYQRKQRFDAEGTSFYKKAETGRSAALKTSVDEIVENAVREGVKDIVYPQLDQAAGKPSGYFRDLQLRQSALLKVRDAATATVKELGKQDAAIKGMPMVQKITKKASLYAHPLSGRGGISLHKLNEPVGVSKLSFADAATRSAFARHPVESTVNAARGTKVGINASPARVIAPREKKRQLQPLQ